MSTETTSQPAVETLERSRYIRFGEMTWPAVDNDLMWRLRYAQESISTMDKFYLASIMDAYRELIQCNREKREMVCRAVREGE